MIPFADISIQSLSFGQILIAIVVIAACCALVFVALRQFGISIPSWVAQIIWIVVIAFLVIVAIRLVLSF